jgi:hypothetical protein
LKALTFETLGKRCGLRQRIVSEELEDGRKVPSLRFRPVVLPVEVGPIVDAKLLGCLSLQFAGQYASLLEMLP